MELVKPRNYGELAAEKIAKELTAFKGNRYGEAVKTFVASTLTNFCGQSERFAKVVFETKATLSDCCAEIMKKCGDHISDIDVYRGAVRYYFPNAEVQFTMTIDASGDIPSADEMAKPKPQAVKEADGNSTQPARRPQRAAKATQTEKKNVPAPQKKKPEKQARAVPEDKPTRKPKMDSKTKNAGQDDGLIQLSLF